MLVRVLSEELAHTRMRIKRRSCIQNEHAQESM
jgi:hypothetical protein